MSEANEALRSVLASARALVEELAEEGVDAYVPGQAPAHQTTATATGDAAASKARPAQSTATSRQAPASPALSPAPVLSPAPSSAPSPESIAASPITAPHTSETADWGDQPTLEAVRDVLGDCQRCGLCEGRRNIVFGDGNPQADILFVGEGPGENEDLQGLPFVGRAGELLTQMIEKGMGLPRSEVYICNIVKCRPPNNRNPLAPEVSACRPFLDGQIDAVRPRVIVSLGKPAASLLLGRDVAITRTRGQWQEYRGIPLMPTLHPAFVLRQYTAENRRAVWEDLKAALARSSER